MAMVFFRLGFLYLETPMELNIDIYIDPFRLRPIAISKRPSVDRLIKSRIQTSICSITEPYTVVTDINPKARLCFYLALTF